MKKIVVDIYRLTDKEMSNYQLYYKNRIKFYNYDLEIIEDYALPEENINNYYVGKIVNE